MLTGKRAFEGEDASDTLAAVLRAEPDWSALPDDVSDAIRVLLKRCLLKDRHQRVANLGVARFVMSEATVARVERGSAVPPSSVSAPLGTKLVLAGIAGLIIGALVAGGGAILASRRTPPAQLPVPIRLTVDVERTAAQAYPDREIAISADGSRIAYRDGAAISVRDLSALEPRVIDGTDCGPYAVFLAGRPVDRLFHRERAPEDPGHRRCPDHTRLNWCAAARWRLDDEGRDHPVARRRRGSAKGSGERWADDRPRTSSRRSDQLYVSRAPAQRAGDVVHRRVGVDKCPDHQRDGS